VRGWFGGENGDGGKYETIWALKDVTFEVQPGEVVGIIGRNGAGKSTLLKILSRITEPTTGRVEIRGRVGSLLEVGTGFHPELTGRENVYLNGAILGMKRAEVDRKFDEIVAFAEVEKFIDTPVKHYSSGMYVRLAFSVAAHLDTDILLVDEVLSVGDVKFQQKCMGKMQDRAFADKTILFVSHNLPAVAQFCRRAVLFESGNLVAEGDTARVLPLYLGGAECEKEVSLAEKGRRGARGERWEFMKKVRFVKKGTAEAIFTTGEEWHLEVECEFPAEFQGRRICLGFDVRDGLDRILFGTNTDQYGHFLTASEGRQVIRASVAELNLVPGKYSVSLFLGDGKNDYEVIERAATFEVIWDRQVEVQRHPWVGAVFQRVSWSV
jgi:lipopolysaccharide transport system ATP-binding protein